MTDFVKKVQKNFGQNSVLKVVIKGSTSQNFKSTEIFFALTDFVLTDLKKKKKIFFLNFF